MKLSSSQKLIIIGMFLLGALVMFLLSPRNVAEPPQKHWKFQSIDTMKYSRDLARQKLNDHAFTAVVDKQVSDIADTGTTHVAIGTPYDAEFLPVLKLWVRTARLHGLKVWFRGNWSGWEGWFDYPAISESEHTEKTSKFILENSSLFEDGDVFTSCPECENRADINFGNPQEVAHYRSFLVNEYQVTKTAFDMINKKVVSNYYSMNADVAKAVMDPATTTALDGVVTIDHYVATPEKLAQDVAFISEQSGGKVVLGEMGAPIPDIHGAMTDEEQRQWLSQAFALLAAMPQVEGINYWVNLGGSTSLWNDKGVAKPAVTIVKYYYGGSHR